MANTVPFQLTTTFWCDMTNFLVHYKPDNIFSAEGYVIIHQNWSALSNQQISQSFQDLMALQTTYHPTIPWQKMTNKQTL
jgi:hypothetical protein